MKKNLITTALLLGSSTFVYGESSDTELPPINVYSAYATPVNQDQTASSITVLTEKDFASRNATYVSDVLKTVPGVAMGVSGGRGTSTSLFLRGANSKHTAVIIDGIRVNPADTNFDFGGLSLSNIEQIEVLRGEQSALWGSDAMGGVVYITTKSGLYKDKPFNIDFDLGTGSHRTRDGSVTISGQKDGFYYALHGDSHRTRGISARSERIFNYTSIAGKTTSNVPASEKDGFHRDHLSLRLGFDDGKKGIDFLTSHSSQTLHFDNSATNEKAFDDNTHIRETHYKLSGYVGNSDDLFVHKALISHIKTDNNTTQYSSWTSSVGKTEYESKKLNANYQLDINFDREGEVKQAMSLLADYQNTKYIASAYNFNNKKLTEKSIAAEYRLFTESDHSLSFSGRYTDNSLFENAFTARIAGAYRLSPNFKAHASFGKAIHNPTMSEFYGWSGTWLANPNLKAEKSLGGELGLLMESNNKHHSLDLTYFARNVDNFLSDDSVLGDYSRATNQAVNRNGKTKIKGIEVTYSGKFTNNLSGYANYTYTYIKSENDQYGLNYVRRPKHTSNLGLAYQITEKLDSSLNVSYMGKRLDSGDFKMPSYTLVNLGVNYQISSNLNIYAHLNNVFDKKYENIIGYGQDGRNVYVGLKGSF
ncbi:TonB-dependent receptor plug domain-containing protein [Rodentibacter pneumotropicus]|uniref:TonB-dependent receptor n=1 Tax=Rodentibacter pneumotropicus TaxID=758 RepID=A0A4S2PFR1_9PAST|nr:TonB-dependent receptor [Rodentibacter pneumotropicus]THA02029.1 TonB-dependent receptor [Rodentibacter pneumotropicus]THA02507.1 TonB-dependent receptor [Rodentibacter pneumotropicus]THA06859.1 TonB-dependent receptor [Rodentibacter pneumotropicus]THA17847.1 TonB-dependent receptor [Rodentibacter pneumotropicus]